MVQRQNGTVASDLKSLLNYLVNVTCNGKPAFRLYSCVNNGTLCSGQGVCINSKCTCPRNRSGTYCESDVDVDGSSTDRALYIALGMIIIISCFCCCC